MFGDFTQNETYRLKLIVALSDFREFLPTPHLQNAVVNITAQVLQLTTSENVVLYDPGTC